MELATWLAAARASGRVSNTRTGRTVLEADGLDDKVAENESVRVGDDKTLTDKLIAAVAVAERLTDPDRETDTVPLMFVDSEEDIVPRVIVTASDAVLLVERVGVLEAVVLSEAEFEAVDVVVMDSEDDRLAVVDWVLSSVAVVVTDADGEGVRVSVTHCVLFLVTTRYPVTHSPHAAPFAVQRLHTAADTSGWQHSLPTQLLLVHSTSPP